MIPRAMENNEGNSVQEILIEFQVTLPYPEPDMGAGEEGYVFHVTVVGMIRQCSNSGRQQ